MKKRGTKRKPDLNAELILLLQPTKKGGRSTEFALRADGRWRRSVVLPDGTVENDQILPAESAQVARAGSGLSQAKFAKLIGVSMRTLQEWEQGRKRPSGPAAALLRIVARHPDIVTALHH
jgi:putative transcriptional regulator